MTPADAPVSVDAPRVLPNPLHDLHAVAQLIEFQPYDQLEIVSTFGEPQAEYAAIRKSCGLMDCPQRGILELTGRDRLPFLNNLLTNQTWDKQTKSGMQSGQGVYAFFLNVKGRIAADMNVLELSDRTLLEMDARFVSTIRQAFEKYLFAEQVTMRELVGVSHEIALHGPGARQVLETALGAPMPELGQLGSTKMQFFGADAVAHGCTGKGNDQVRFEVSLSALAPEIEVLAPVRDWGMNRAETIDYAKERGLPITSTKSSPYSIEIGRAHV